MPANIRYQIWRLLDWESGERASRICGILIAALIIVNVAAAILGTVKTGAVKEFYGSYRLALVILENASLAVFTIEYFLRLWASPEGRRLGQTCADWRLRVRHAFGFYNIIDFLAIAPLIFGLIFNAGLQWTVILRVLRLLKMARYFQSFGVLLDVIAEEKRTLGSAVVMLAFTLILASVGIYLAENESNPEKFASIPAAMWWAIITITTVGYGDVFPITLAGKIFSGIVAIVGIGMVAIPTGILVNGIGEYYSRRKKARDSEADAREIIKVIQENADFSPEQIQVITQALQSRNNQP